MKKIFFVFIVLLTLAFSMDKGYARGGHGGGFSGGGGHSGGWGHHGGGWGGHHHHGGWGLGFSPGYYSFGLGYGPGYYGGYYPWGGYGGYYGPSTIVTVPRDPPVYIQQQRPATQQFQTGYWYYCSNPEGYYPYIKECLARWQPVEPRPSVTH